MSAISITANLPRLIDSMGKAFTDSHTVVFELIQNAERSGATEIHITHGPGWLQVVDNGHGIRNPEKLLALAESDWSPAIMAERSPYGLGFMAALFAADRIRVQSLDFQFEATTEELLALKPVEVKPAPLRVDGTQVLLGGTRFDEGRLRSELQHRLVGFPIPVFFHGKELQRPAALSAPAREGWRKTPVGMVRLDLDAPVVTSYWTLILQGLRFVEREPSFSSVVVHLDPTRYFGRLPDRTALVDEERVKREVYKAVVDLAREMLQEAKAALPPEEFVVRHYEHCLRWGCLQLLNDIPYVSADWLIQWDGAPRYPGELNFDDCFQEFEAEGSLIHRDAVPAVVLSRIEEGEDLVSCNLPFLLYAWQKNYPILEATLDNGHWIYERICPLPRHAGFGEKRIEIKVKPGALRGERKFNGNWNAVLKVYDEIRLDGPDGEVVLPPGVGVVHHDDYRELAVQPETDDNVLLQLDSYRDDEVYLDTVFNEDSNTFYRLKRQILGSSPAESLLAALRQSGIYDEVLAALVAHGPVVLSASNGEIVVTSNRA